MTLGQQMRRAWDGAYAASLARLEKETAGREPDYQLRERAYAAADEIAAEFIAAQFYVDVDVDGWRPIATAPRDGTWVILAGGNCHGDDGDNDGRPVTAQWTMYRNGETNPNYIRWQFAWYAGGHSGVYDEPTHWKPLPLGPR